MMHMRFEMFTNENIKRKAFRRLRSFVLMRDQAECSVCYRRPKHRVHGSLYVVPKKEIPHLLPEEYTAENLHIECANCYKKKEDPERSSN